MRKVYQSVSQIMAEILSQSDDLISPETSLSGLNYQELAAAAMACEKIFHIELEDERIPFLSTVSDWVDYIKERLRDDEADKKEPTDQDREAWYYR